jgi:predicted amidohydrolase
MRVAAVQMTPLIADVPHNLAAAERLVRDAIGQGAALIVLPEFFTSGMAFHPDMAGAVEPFDGRPAQMLIRLARESGASIGGSFLAWRSGHARNTFVLARPDGTIAYHDKDHPTFLENCYYEGGYDAGLMASGDLRVGAALCWEFIRTQTAARLLNRVDLVVGGSCWWQRADQDAADNLAVLQGAPHTFARLVGVPVVHASHAGSFEGGTVTTRDFRLRRFRYLGETQIVDAEGTVLARLSEADGEGVVLATITPGPSPSPRQALPSRFWIPALPPGWDTAWRTSMDRDHDYYLDHTRPHLLRRLTGLAS